MTILCVNSYPRSGNTYLALCIEKFIELNNIKDVDFKLKNHEHAMLFDKSVQQVFILRNPLDSITSYALMMLWPVIKTIKNEELIKFIDDITDLYVRFLDNILKSEGVAFIFFEDLVSRDINIFIEQIFDYFLIKKPENIKVLSKDDLLSVKTYMKTMVQNNTYSGHYPRDYSLMPERESMLSLVKNGSFYKDAVKLHGEVSHFFKSSKGLLRGGVLV